jgi:hypothetical protein
VTTAGIAAGNHRPAVVGEGDSFRPHLGAEGVPPSVRRVHLGSFAVTVSNVTKHLIQAARYRDPRDVAGRWL